VHLVALGLSVQMVINRDQLLVIPPKLLIEASYLWTYQPEVPKLSSTLMFIAARRVERPPATPISPVPAVPRPPRSPSPNELSASERTLPCDDRSS
jgi:hypothetical protein